MKKSANTDIRNLFGRFGGDIGNYREIQQASVSDKAKKNWPIVKAMEKSRPIAPRLKASAHATQVRGPAAMPVTSPQADASRSAIRIPRMSAHLDEPVPVRQASIGIQPDQAAQTASNRLEAVFSRLNNPKKHDVVAPGNKTLRSLFGFFHK